MEDIRSSSKSTFVSSTPKMAAKSTSHSRERCDRKTLVTIQPTGGFGIKYIDVNHADHGDSKCKQSVSSEIKSHSSHIVKNAALSIYEDTGTAIESHGIQCTRSVQTDCTLLDPLLGESQLRQMDESTDSGHLSGYMDPEAYDLMANESIPDHYWKEVAEERRLALVKTLEENKELHDENDRLKKENGRLSNIAHKAEELEQLLKTVLSEDEDEDEAGNLEDDQSSSEENKDSIDKKQDSNNEDNHAAESETQVPQESS